jgi:hypothetical protein
MSEVYSPSDRVAKWLRYIARATALVLVAGWLFTGIVGALFSRDPWTWESTVMSVLVLTLSVGVAIAWRCEGLGGAIVLAGGVAFSAFAYLSAGHNKGYAMLVSGVPFLAAGALSLAAHWRVGRSRRRS